MTGNTNAERQSLAPIGLAGLADVVEQLEVCIVTRDKASARAWYAERLGIVFNDRDRAEVGGVTLVLWGFPDAAPASHVIYQFVTKDLERAHDALRRRGVAVTEINPRDWNFLFADPYGNRIAVYEPRAWRAKRFPAASAASV